MITKKCHRCFETKALSEFTEFVPGKQRWICRKCEYEYKRSKESFLEYQKKYRQEHRSYFKTKLKEWQSRNKNQATTNQRWTDFKRKNGIKNEPCVICGESETEAHHFDYNDPYFIVWLCKKHHGMVKRKKIPSDQYIPYSKDYALL